MKKHYRKGELHIIVEDKTKITLDLFGLGLYTISIDYACYGLGNYEGREYERQLNGYISVLTTNLYRQLQDAQRALFLYVGKSLKEVSDNEN